MRNSLPVSGTQGKSILKLFLIALGIKLAIPLLAFVLCRTGVSAGALACMEGPGCLLDRILQVYFNSDSGWYSTIIAYGYQDVPDGIASGFEIPNQHYAFFPLFPMLVRWLMLAGGFSMQVSAFVISIPVLFMLVRVYYLFMRENGLTDAASFRVVLISMLFPFSLHLFLVYTESLFMMLMLWCFLCIARKQWAGFALLSAMLVLCRPNGLLMAVPFGVYMLEQHTELSFKGFIKAIRQPLYYTLFAMPLAFAGWMLVQYALTGDLFAFSKAQAGWNKQAMFPLLAFFRNGFWQDQFSSVYTIAVMVFSASQFKKWPLSFSLLVWINILLPLSAGSVVSMTRYISILFPLYIALGRNEALKPMPFRLLMFALMAAQVVCVGLWLRSDSLMY